MAQQYLSSDPNAGEPIATRTDPTEALRALQQMASTSAMRAHGNEPPVDNYSTDPRTGAHVTRVPHGKIPVLDALGESYVQGGPMRMLQALRDLSDGNYSKGGYDAIAGAMTTAAPVTLPMAARSMGLLRTGAGLAAGAGGDVAGQGLARGLNANEDQADLMGILTSLLTGGVAVKASEGASPMSVGRAAVKGYDAVRHPLRTVADTVVDAVRKATAEAPGATPPAPAPRTSMIDLATRAAKGDEEAKAILAILRPGRSGRPVEAHGAAPPPEAAPTNTPAVPAPSALSVAAQAAPPPMPGEGLSAYQKRTRLPFSQAEARLHQVSEPIPAAPVPPSAAVAPAPAGETSTPTPRARSRTTAAAPAATTAPKTGRASRPTAAANGEPSSSILSDPRERAVIEKETARLVARGLSPDKVVESIVTQLQLNQRLGGVTPGEASAKVAHWMRTGEW